MIPRARPRCSDAPRASRSSVEAQGNGAHRISAVRAPVRSNVCRYGDADLLPGSSPRASLVLDATQRARRMRADGATSGDRRDALRVFVRHRGCGPPRRPSTRLTGAIGVADERVHARSPPSADETARGSSGRRGRTSCRSGLERSVWERSAGRRPHVGGDCANGRMTFLWRGVCRRSARPRAPSRPQALLRRASIFANGERRIAITPHRHHGRMP